MRPHPSRIRDKFVGAVALASQAICIDLERHEKVAHTGAHVAAATFGT